MLTVHVCTYVHVKHKLYMYVSWYIHVTALVCSVPCQDGAEDEPLSSDGGGGLSAVGNT